MNKVILVTGGAGYIGSHAVALLKEKGWSPVILDNFVYGNKDIAKRLDVPLEEGDTIDKHFLNQVIEKHKPVAVMHFSAYAYVGESVQNPKKYYNNNVVGTLSLLDALVENDISNVIFSSTCATYGTPNKLPIAETTPQIPINPYGRTKLIIEEVLFDYEKAYGLNSVIFRYFNAAGAHPELHIGERHDPETHLIPLIIKAAMEGGSIKVFGDDYDTADGTCIRDYIHVLDIASAHVLGLERLLSKQESGVYNIGTGVGNSVLEVIKAVERVSGKSVEITKEGRRAGDPPVLVAESAKLQRELGWTPAYKDIDKIVETAWNWHVYDSKQK
jgi:UDP-glucose 4-epimerase